MKIAIDLLENNISPIILEKYCVSTKDTEYHNYALKILERTMGKKIFDHNLLN